MASSLDEKILLAVVRVSERFKRESAALFAVHGVSFPQYNLLRVLAGLPEESGSVSQISNQLLVSTPNLSGIAKRLEKTGLISRGRDPGDERKTVLTLQPAGRRLLALIQPLQEAKIESFLAAWPGEQKRAVLALLKQVLPPLE